MGQCGERTNPLIIPIPEIEAQTWWSCSYCSRPCTFSHFSVGVVDPVSSILEVSQQVVCVFLSPHEWLEIVVLMKTKSMWQPHIPLTIKRYKTKRKTKPNNCKCPEQNIWKIKQVLSTEMLKNTALNKHHDCENGPTQLSASVPRGSWNSKQVKDRLSLFCRYPNVFGTSQKMVYKHH